MALEINIRKARLTDSEFLLKIHNESVKRKFIDSTSIDKKILIFGISGLKKN